MLILAVDTSTRSGSVALLHDDEVLRVATENSGELYSSRLCGTVDTVLSTAGIALHQVDLYAVAAGPGSFTGLRIGLTAIKAWAEVFGKPIVPIGALHAIAEQVK